MRGARRTAPTSTDKPGDGDWLGLGAEPFFRPSDDDEETCGSRVPLCDRISGGRPRRARPPFDAAARRARRRSALRRSSRSRTRRTGSSRPPHPCEDWRPRLGQDDGANLGLADRQAGDEAHRRFITTSCRACANCHRCPPGFDSCARVCPLHSARCCRSRSSYRRSRSRSWPSSCRSPSLGHRPRTRPWGGGRCRCARPCPHSMRPDRCLTCSCRSQPLFRRACPGVLEVQMSQRPFAGRLWRLAFP